MGTIEVDEYDKKFGAYLVVYTSECASWAEGGDKPLAVSITSACGFMNLGLEVATDGRPFTDMKVGEKTADIDWGGEHEGVYIMRIG